MFIIYMMELIIVELIPSNILTVRKSIMYMMMKATLYINMIPTIQTATRFHTVTTIMTTALVTVKKIT